MKRGSISVFLSLLLSASLVFVLVVAEASRYAGLRLTARQAGAAAADSIFASFDRGLLEDYGLLFYNGGRGAESIRCELIENDYQHYFYENANKNRQLTGGSFFRIGRADADVTEVITAVDYNGEIFVRSALEFFKFDAVSELAGRIREELELITQGDRLKESVDSGGNESSLLDQLKPLEPAASESGQEGEEGFDHEKLEDSINTSAIGAAEKVRAKGWMWLALPGDKTISGKALDKTGLPSEASRDLRKLNGSVFDSTTDCVLFNEYLLAMFPCFVSEPPETGLHYQLEYLITGKDSDDKALKAVLNKMLLTREGMNMLHIFTSSPKRLAVEELTMLLVGWTGITPLIALVEVGLIAAWAYAESIMDMRILLSGGKVPVVKTEEDWNLRLATVIDFLLGADITAEKHQRGLSYEDYLRLLLFSTDSHELAYRAMDLIQTGKRETDPGFTMSSQIYAMEIRTTVSAEELFSSVPLVSGMLGYGNTAYEWEEYYSGSY